MANFFRTAGKLKKGKAFEASIYVSLILNLVLMMGIFYGRPRNFFAELPLDWTRYLAFFLWHLGCNILLFYLLFLFNFRIVTKWMNSKKRVFYAFAGSMAICLILSPAFSQFQWFLLGGRSDLGLTGFSVFNIIKDMIVAIVVILLTYIFNIYEKREQTIILNQKLQQENIRIKYEALKNQLDPHFLFNSLNTLNGLIGVDDNKAHDYIENMSSVFRYTLHSKNIGTLDDEIEFVEAYFSLLKIRYENNLVGRYNIDKRYLDYYIMPASLQLLVENAVKHNVITNKKTLFIDIATTDHNSIIVSNPINLKKERSGGGIGLANLSNRYSLLFGLSIKITDTDGVFSVEIPLIKELNENFKNENSNY